MIGVSGVLKSPTITVLLQFLRLCLLVFVLCIEMLLLIIKYIFEAVFI